MSTTSTGDQDQAIFPTLLENTSSFPPLALPAKKDKGSTPDKNVVKGALKNGDANKGREDDKENVKGKLREMRLQAFGGST